MAGIFVTGTDTSVGKTAVAAGIAGALRHKGYDVGVMKAVESGAASGNGRLYSQDARFMLKASCSRDEEELTCPVLLKEALAPYAAAKLEGRVVDVSLIKNAYVELEKRHDFVIVEGAGGIAVPLKERFLVSDLISLLDIPAVIVARCGLGTINHTFLTVEYLRKSGVSIAGVVFNDCRGDKAGETSPGMISELTGVRVLGTIPHDPKISTETGELGDIVQLVRKHVDIEAIASAIFI